MWCVCVCVVCGVCVCVCGVCVCVCVGVCVCVCVCVCVAIHFPSLFSVMLCNRTISVAPLLHTTCHCSVTGLLQSPNTETSDGAVKVATTDVVQESFKQ